MYLISEKTSHKATKFYILTLKFSLWLRAFVAKISGKTNIL